MPAPDPPDTSIPWCQADKINNKQTNANDNDYHLDLQLYSGMTLLKEGEYGLERSRNGCAAWRQASGVDAAQGKIRTW
ncbi:hypothetical protein [Duganella caerulea]|uniref:hypothetical protein n=1 Tax=Duganella caerulea TaxID=2885762 RepID=UPI004037D24B